LGITANDLLPLIEAAKRSSVQAAGSLPSAPEIVSVALIRLSGAEFKGLTTEGTEDHRGVQRPHHRGSQRKPTTHGCHTRLGKYYG